MLGLVQKALRDENLAHAIVRRALLGEGSILTGKMGIIYNDEKTMRSMFAFAKRWSMADNSHVKHALRQVRYGFAIEAHARHPIYGRIGPLPDETKNVAFKHLLRDIDTGPKCPQNTAKEAMTASHRQCPRRSGSLHMNLICQDRRLSGISTIFRKLEEPE